MTVAARLINANLGFRVLDLGLDGFDTHDNQPGNHPDLLTQLDNGLATFFSTLNPAYYNRVTVMTMSEFGRTPYSNDSAGTDHGTANVLFVMGPNVKGGHYGQPASFGSITDQWDRFEMTTDFRHVLGTVIDGWMGGGASTILNGQYQNLGFFQVGPGDPPPSGGIPPIVTLPSIETEFVSMNPVRLFDTRDGTGGRLGRLGAGESWPFTIRGRYRRARRGGCGGHQPHRGRRHSADLRHRLAGRTGAADDVEPQPGAGHGRSEPGNHPSRQRRRRQLLQQRGQRSPARRRRRVLPWR